MSIKTGTTGSDTLVGGVGELNVLIGFDGDDCLVGGSVTDVLVGDAGNDTLITGLGFAQAIGGVGVDVMVLQGTASDWLVNPFFATRLDGTASVQYAEIESILFA